MLAIIVCDRFKWTLEEYENADSSFVDKVFQYITIEAEVRNRQQKKEQSSASKGRR